MHYLTQGRARTSRSSATRTLFKCWTPGGAQSPQPHDKAASRRSTVSRISQEANREERTAEKAPGKAVSNDDRSGSSSTVNANGCAHSSLVHLLSPDPGRAAACCTAKMGSPIDLTGVPIDLTSPEPRGYIFGEATISNKLPHIVTPDSFSVHLGAISKSADQNELHSTTPPATESFDLTQSP
jgi:hypothetical protein